MGRCEQEVNTSSEIDATSFIELKSGQLDLNRVGACPLALQFPHRSLRAGAFCTSVRHTDACHSQGAQPTGSSQSWLMSRQPMTEVINPAWGFLARSKRGTRPMPAWLFGGTRRIQCWHSGWEETKEGAAVWWRSLTIEPGSDFPIGVRDRGHRVLRGSRGPGSPGPGTIGGETGQDGAGRSARTEPGPTVAHSGPPRPHVQPPPTSTPETRSRDQIAAPDRTTACWQRRPPGSRTGSASVTTN